MVDFHFAERGSPVRVAERGSPVRVAERGSPVRVAERGSPVLKHSFPVIDACVSSLHS